MILPADAHVHSEWSWDTGGPLSAAAGTMEATCARAVRIGLPAVIFTEHLDFDRWHVGDGAGFEQYRALIDGDGYLRPPPFEIDGYLENIDRCRSMFPDLSILTGVEFGQPHLFDAQAADLLDLTSLDRVNGSLHTLAIGEDRSEPITLFRRWPPDTVIWEYLAEVPRMVVGSDSFAVFTHIDYAARHWPTVEAGPFDPRRFEEGFRFAMRSIAESDRALELNTGRLWPWVPQWWAEEGGRAVTFGSDAHTFDVVGRSFPEAVAMAEYFGFRAGARPEYVWTR